MYIVIFADQTETSLQDPKGFLFKKKNSLKIIDGELGNWVTFYYHQEQIQADGDTFCELFLFKCLSLRIQLKAGLNPFLQVALCLR